MELLRVEDISSQALYYNLLLRLPERHKRMFRNVTFSHNYPVFMQVIRPYLTKKDITGLVNLHNATASGKEYQIDRMFTNKRQAPKQLESELLTEKDIFDFIERSGEYNESAKLLYFTKDKMAPKSENLKPGPFAFIKNMQNAGLAPIEYDKDTKAVKKNAEIQNIYYLFVNKPDGIGGEVYFPQLNRAFLPKAGDLLIVRGHVEHMVGVAPFTGTSFDVDKAQHIITGETHIVEGKTWTPKR